MNEARICEHCQTPLPPDAPGGKCPHCLLGLGMQGLGSTRSSEPTAAHSNGNPYPVPSAEQLVDKFPNLEIEHLVGQGGMGAVYQARQKNLDRVVALKILSPRLGKDPTFTERFIREARTLAKLSHPNIVTVYDFGTAGGISYLVMEFIDGINLRDSIEAGTIEPSEALAIVPQICDALQYAHDQGVVHRDIKPENILISRNGHVKIADFGLAKLLAPSAEEFTLTSTRQVMGTLKYMAPEQIEKPQRVDHRADLYSLGVVFYELLTGELPIGRFAMPSEKAAVSHQLDNVVLKTLEKEPDRRYQQASQLKTAVEALGKNGNVDFPHRVSAEAAAKFNAPRPQSASATRKSPAIPFTTDDIYGGMAKGYGIARICEPDTLEVEFEVRDCMGVTKSTARTVNVPIDKLSSVRFKPGIFGDTVRVQSETMQAVADIPGSQQGAVNLYTKKADAVAAQALVNHLNGLLSTGLIDRKPVAPVKSGARDWDGQMLSPSDYVSVVDQLKAPALGMLVTGLAHLFLSVFAFVTLIRRAMPGVDQLDVYSDKLLAFLGRYMFLKNEFEILATGLISLGFAVVLLSAAVLLFRQRNYVFAKFLSILACLPIHLFAILTLPIGIWSLVVLENSKTKRVFHERAMAVTFRSRKPQGEHNSIASLIQTLFVFFILGFGALAGLGIIMVSIWWKTRAEDSRIQAIPSKQVIVETQSRATNDSHRPSGEAETKSIRIESHSRDNVETTQALESVDSHAEAIVVTAETDRWRKNQIVFMAVLIAILIPAIYGVARYNRRWQQDLN